jgi:hypothetical protein
MIFGSFARRSCEFQPCLGHWPWSRRSHATRSLRCGFVLRGTADESVHAKLRPITAGYTVTLQGSLLGRLELFLMVYLSSTLVGETSQCHHQISSRGEVL